MIEKPSKELSTLLQTRIMIERANSECVTKQDGVIFKQFYLLSDKSNAFTDFKSSYGDIISYDFKLTAKEAFHNLAEAIKAYAARIRFHMLELPIAGSVDHVIADISSNVIVRMIEYYEIRSDEILTRYDVLVEKVQ